MNSYDVIVIGGGPGGYTAATQTAKAGLSTLLIEATAPGGTCLNAGCIPTKTLLHTAKLYAQMQELNTFGIELDTKPRLNWSTLMQRKHTVMDKLRNGIIYRMHRSSVEIINGYARFRDRNTIQVGDKTCTARNIVIATGASPRIPSFTGATFLVTTTELLSLDELPSSIVMLGAGEIALGLATIFAHCGVDVTIVNQQDSILPGYEPELIEILLQDLPPVKFYSGLTVQNLADNTLTLADGTQLSGDVIAFTGDRSPNIRGFGLEEIGLDMAGDCINVDEQMRTNLPGVYAAGDVTGLSMWAHSAQRMGEVAASTISGHVDRFQLAHIPTVIYSDPQLATVGLTEQLARDLGYEVQVARLPLNYNGRFLAEHDPGAGGLCKIVVNASNNQLLGLHIVGGNASELIFGAATMLADEFRIQDVQQLVFPHPAVAEVIKDTLYEL